MPERYDRAAAERQVREAVAEVIVPESIDEWLVTPAPIFDGRSAKDLLDTGEEGRDQVLAAIDALASGAFI